MEELILFIKEQLHNIEKHLSDIQIKDKKKFILQKNELTDFLFLIELYKKYDIKQKNILNIYALPYLEGSGYSEYRILCDYETEKRELWEELKIDHEYLRLYPEDIIIKKR